MFLQKERINDLTISIDGGESLTLHAKDGVHVHSGVMIVGDDIVIYLKCLEIDFIVFGTTIQECKELFLKYIFKLWMELYRISLALGTEIHMDEKQRQVFNTFILKGDYELFERNT